MFFNFPKILRVFKFLIQDQMKVNVLHLVVSLTPYFTTDRLLFLLFFMTLIWLKSLARSVVLNSVPQSGFVIVS